MSENQTDQNVQPKAQDDQEEVLEQNQEEQTNDGKKDKPTLANLKVNKKGFIEAEGEVVDLMPGAKFKVQLDNGHEITATLSGKMRINNIILVLGDRVKVEMTPYDLTKGRIVYRF